MWRRNSDAVASVQDKNATHQSCVYIAFTWRSLLWIDWFDIYHAFIGKEKELHVYADPQLKEIIMIQLDASKTELAYPLFFHPLDYKAPKLLFEDDKIQVKSFPLKHSIDCCGFLVEEKQLERRMISEAIIEHNIPVNCIPAIKAGGDFIKSDGSTISHWELTKSAHRARSYAFCSDTAYCEAIVPIVKG